MKKGFFIGLLILLVIIISGCHSANNPTLYFFEGDNSTYVEKDNKFILVDSENELLKIKSSIKTLNENKSIRSELTHMKSYFKKNQIGLLYKVDSEVNYNFLFEEETNMDDWFKNNKLIYCCVTTKASGYQAEVYLKKDKDNKTNLVLNNFNNFQGEGDDEIKTFNFFISLSNEEVANLIISLDSVTIVLER